MTGLISVVTASTSLVISSFLTRNVAGLIVFHGVVFGCSCGLGYMVSVNYTVAMLTLDRVRTPFQANTFSRKGDCQRGLPLVEQGLAEQRCH